MQKGILRMPEKGEMENAKKKGVVIGVSVVSLIDDIEFNLYRSKYDAAAVLQLIHHDLLLIAGRIQVPPKSEVTEDGQ